MSQHKLSCSQLTCICFSHSLSRPTDSCQLQYSGLGSNNGMGFLHTNDSSEVKNGEFGLDFKVVIKTGGWWFGN